MPEELDAIIIGAGHNGLTCAAYLGRAGLKVRVVERRGIVGGACVTEEFYPGFRNSTAAYTVSLLQPKIIRELKLAEHGLRIAERRAQNFLPLPDGRHLLTGEGRSESEIAKFSTRDAARYAAYQAEIGRVADVLRGLILQAPPNIRMAGPGGFLRGVLRGLAGFGALGRRLWKDDALAAALRLFRRSAGDMLDGWFDSDPIKAVLGFDAVVGNLASPYAPGSAYVLLHHAFGEVNGKRGVWGHALGGMGAITTALARAAASAGVRVDVDAPVREIMVERGRAGASRAAGVVLDDGTTLRARAVIGNVDPRTLLQTLLPAGALPGAAAARLRHWQAGSGTFRMNVALARLPDFTALPGPGDHLTAGIILAPSLAYMDKAFRDCVAQGFSKQPIVELVIASTLDDSLAPPGAHVASLFCQHVSPHLPAQLPGGANWDDQRERVADLMIDTVEAYAPGFKASVIARQALTPLDLERIFGLPDGDIFHGRMTPGQIFAARPLRGFADYRMPVAGLYLCGAGAHPGGGVSGAPGHNAAAAVIADLAVLSGSRETAPGPSEGG